MKSLPKAFLSILVLWSCILNYSFADEHCNSFVDDVLTKLKGDKDFFVEPYEIPDNEKSYGLYNIEMGHVYGLNTLHRDGDVVPYIHRSGSTHLKIYLGAGEIMFKCTVKKKFFHIGAPISIDAKVPYVTMEIDVLPKSDGSEPKIVNFQIEEVKGLSVKASGLGVIRNAMYNVFLRMVTGFFTKMVKVGIEDRLENFLKNKVKEFKIPAECLGEAWE